MRRFNPDRELNKIRNGRKNKIMLCICTLLLIIAVGSTYALYQVRHTNKIVYTTVEKFVNKDIILSVKLDDKDESVNEFPDENAGYYYSHTECEKGNITDITWNEGQRSLNMNSKGPDKCTVYFSKRVTEFAYNGTDGTDGSIQEYEVPKTGDYKLEVWGAQGGHNGGYGGYSVGESYLEKGTKLYIAVGGQGMVNGDGGYNGGGIGKNNSDTVWGSGGGATHIATDSGILSTFESKLEKILIVAGGGGGGGTGSIQGNSNIGGHAGGYIGVKGEGACPGNGGTQSDGGTGCSDKSSGFGQGGSLDRGSGGGGGLYGGGAGYTHASAAGGGSSYISSTLSNASMYCYNCTVSNEKNTLTVSVESVDANPVSAFAKQGNGAARITYLGN